MIAHARLRATALTLKHLPAKLRALVRAREAGLVLAGAGVGVCAGLLVAAMHTASQKLHEILFEIETNQPLSAAIGIDSHRVLLVPAVGGLLLGAFLYGLSRARRRQPIDPIEANALHGGNMSSSDSIIVAVQNIISNGFGASVGLEAGYTQVGSAAASRLGRWLRLRRNDQRLLVGCGAAGAIAAAFNAPLAGAFYGFELIIGTYSIAALTPVMASAIVATFVIRFLIGGPALIQIGDMPQLAGSDYFQAVIIGLLCAAGGILLMRGVTSVEELMRRLKLASYLRPGLGGLAVGSLALVAPQVLSAGHGALHIQLVSAQPLQALAIMIALKSLASAISIGSGFRGGLFFASLFLGSLLGSAYADIGHLIAPEHAMLPQIAAVIAMSGLAVAVIGGPLTMTFLALEMTGDFPVTVAVLVAVCVSTITVRETFGYSFATWRFHLRGETIRSAHDVGWIRTLSVDRLMRHDVRTVRDDLSVIEFQHAFPMGSTQRVVVVDHDNRYAGIVLVPEAHATEIEPGTEPPSLRTLLRYRNDVLEPTMNVKQAIAAFERTESDALAVIDSMPSRRVVGLLTEAHALRRYAEELDRRRRELSGDL